MDNAPIFVVGSQRSGTSFLADLLNAHADIRLCNELWVLKIAGDLRKSLKDKIQYMFDEQQSDGWADEVTDRVTEVVMAYELERTGKRRFGDKHPHYSMCIPQLIKRFPNAKIVHIIRDGRDVATSKMKAREISSEWRNASWSADTWKEASAQWERNVRQARKDGINLGPEQYFEMRYEDLRDRREEVVVRMFQFIGEEVDEGIAAKLATFNRTTKDWRATMTPANIQEFESHEGSRELLAELGYPPSPVSHSDVPLDPTVLSARVERLVTEGKDTEAAALIERAVGQGLDHPLPWNDLGVIAIKNGQEEAGVAMLAKALSYPQVLPETVINLLSMPNRPESVQAAARAREVADDRLEAILAAWMQARGIDAEAATAMMTYRHSASAAK